MLLLCLKEDTYHMLFIVNNIHFGSAFNIWHNFGKESLIIWQLFKLDPVGFLSNMSIIYSNWHFDCPDLIRTSRKKVFCIKYCSDQLRTIFETKYLPFLPDILLLFFSIIVSFPLVINDWHLVAFIIEEEDLILAFRA